jgi:geranylgeranyl diphosphate synthase type I
VNERSTIPLGQAFQLRDDLAGLYDSGDKIGKSTKSDLREGKMTLLMLKALEMGNLSQVKIIRRALGNPNNSEIDYEAVRPIVCDTGAKQYVEAHIGSLLEKAKEAAPGITADPHSRTLLENLADYLA